METNQCVEKTLEIILSTPIKEFPGLSGGILANKLNIERSSLSRQFQLHTKISLKDFLFMERMTRAAFLMTLNPQITVKEVAEKIGYNNHDYFRQKFKEYYGIGPGKYKEYRQNLLNSQSKDNSTNAETESP